MLVQWCMQFLRLGREGYTKIMKNLGLVAARLQKGIEATGKRLTHSHMTRHPARCVHTDSVTCTQPLFCMYRDCISKSTPPSLGPAPIALALPP